jgi:chromosome segregation ATPase
MAKILKVLIGFCFFVFAMTVIFAQAPQTGTPASSQTGTSSFAGKEGATTTIKERIEKTRQFLQVKRKDIEAKIQAQREILKKRLAKISEQKRTIVDRIYVRVQELNKRMTDHYLDVLEKINEILERIEIKAEKMKSQGVDTAELQKSIENAKTKIEKARQAVLTQAQKIYPPPTITTEKRLKLNVGVTRKQLNTDLKSVERLVKDARAAVQNCAILLGKLSETKPISTSTPQLPVSTSSPTGSAIERTP